MNRLLYVLFVTFGSVLAGYLTRRVPCMLTRSIVAHAGTVSKLLKITALFVLNPIPIINSFWRLRLDSGTLLVFPLLGILSVTVAGLSSIALSRLFRIPPKRAASVFTSGAFTNIISIGGLTAYAFFGHEGFALVPLFNTFVSFSYYAIGFPVSHQLSLEDRSGFSFSLQIIRERPYLMVPLLAIVLGVALNLFGFPRPVAMDSVAAVLIPLVSAMIGYSIGLTLFFGRIGAYRLEIALVTVVKFLIVPSVMIPLGWAIGLPAIFDGVAFKVLVLLSFMPVAFNALVPPVVYGFDLDLANSAWAVTTIGLAFILPVLYFVLVV